MNNKKIKPFQNRKHTEKRSKEVKLAVRHKVRENVGKWRRMIGKVHMFIGAIVFGLAAGWLSYSGVLDTADQMVSDKIYQVVNQKLENSPIRIIAIDEKTVQKYGAYGSWSREQTAKLLEQLDQEEKNAPAVIGLDLDYSEKRDAKGDRALVKTCSNYKNICFSASAERAKPLDEEVDDHPMEQGDANLPEERTIIVNQPFDDLREEAVIGIVNNTINSRDGIVRNAFSSFRADGRVADSFATAVYKMYMDTMGKEYVLPELDEDMSFQFTFSKTGQEYTAYSFCDVAEGKIAPSAFADAIVLVGSYIDDATFRTPNQRKSQMHTMDMQANLLEALLGQRTGQEASKGFMAVFYAFFMAAFFIATSYSSLRLTVVFVALVSFMQFVSCWIVNLFGYYVTVLVPLIMAVVISVYNLIVRYAVVTRNQYAMQDVFEKYVDESVVSELKKDGYIEARIGVTRRDVAVLFVDIRGFTSLSESLQPEQIVDILNKYLELVAKAVKKYHGTLDKFIGDAAMAVFNSPVDLEDYEFRAVCAALELCSNAYSLNEKCKREYGRQVSFGIGIQCGEAVIGNIGCEKRMDYTAIGDTVNTASRLEGVAAPGQILIGSEMMQRLRGRVQAKFAGNFVLKGKKSAVPAYEVEGISGKQNQ